MGKVSTTKIDCASGPRCLGRDDGTPSKLRSLASTESGYCAVCRAKGLDVPFSLDFSGSKLHLARPESATPAGDRSNSPAADQPTPRDESSEVRVVQGAGPADQVSKEGTIKKAPETARASSSDSVYPRPGEIFRADVVALAGRLCGEPVGSYEDAVAIVAADAREGSDLSKPERVIVDLMDAFDDIEARHSGVEAATIATVFLLRQPLVVTNKTGAGVEAVMKAALEQNMEIMIVQAPRVGQSQADIRLGIRKLTLQASRIPSVNTRGIVILVTGLARGAREFKSEVIGAIINRRIGPFAIPAGVHFALAETGSFSVDDYPPEVLMRAVAVNIKGQDDNAVDEVTRAAESRRSMLERALRAVGNDERKKSIIMERLSRTGYVGAFDQASAMSAKGREKVARDQKAIRNEGEPAAEKLAGIGSAHTSAESRTEKAIAITEVIRPERSDLRREVTNRVLSGIGGRVFAANGLANYLRNNGLGEDSGPSVEEIISGTKSSAEIRNALKKGGKAYVASLASELRESPMIEEVMRTGGAAAQRLAETFLAILDFDPEIGKELAKDRPVLAYG